MSRLCRLKTASHGDDGKWAYDEIVALRKQRDELVSLLEEAVSYTCCKSWSPSLTDEINAALASVKGGA